MLFNRRFNHSCRPSAEFSWNPVRKKQEVRVVRLPFFVIYIDDDMFFPYLRPIKRGTEITVSYFSHLVASQDRLSRKKYLQVFLP